MLKEHDGQLTFAPMAEKYENNNFMCLFKINSFHNELCQKV